METVMVRGRYKIVRVLEAGDDYAFAEAVDITEAKPLCACSISMRGRGCPSMRGFSPR